jgi:hypothetical protein
MNLTLTDVTHLHGNLICLAGLTDGGLQTIRPLVAEGSHYMTVAQCSALNLQPGTVIEVGHPAAPLIQPHIEDRPNSTMAVLGRCSGEVFESLLEASAVRSFSAGFGVAVEDKCIPFTTVPTKSIITLETNWANLTVLQDNYGRIRAHVRDAAGVELRYLPVNDLGLCDHVGEPPKRATMARFNEMLAEADKIYLRLGIGRRYATAERDGYWLQVNGIYTFPNYISEIREY